MSPGGRSGAPQPVSSAEMPDHRPVVTSARLIAVCTLASRVAGMARDMLLSQTFGLSGVFDAFNYAFQIPNLFRRLFGEGALAAAFVPVFTRTLEKDGRPAAWRLLARVLALLSIALLALIVVVQSLVLIVWIFGPQTTPQEVETRQLLLKLTAWMAPFMLTICVVALFSSVLNCLGSFVPAALMPIVLNAAMIVGIVVVGPLLGDASQLDRQVFGVAWMVLAAGVLQIALLVPVLRRHGVRLGWKLDTRDPNVRRVLGLMGPVLLGQGVLVLGPFLDSQLCWLLSRIEGGAAGGRFLGFTFDYPLQAGALSALTNAQRLYQFPLGVLAISLAIAVLPLLTRLATRDDWAAWTDEFVRTLRLSIFAGLLAGAMMVVWSAPIVRLLFEYRRFDAQDTLRVAAVMGWYGLGLWAFCAQHIVVRGFYSLGDVRTPLAISCALLPANLLISLALVWLPGVRESAFAIASVSTSTVSVLVGLWLLQRRTGARLLTSRFAAAAARMLLAAVAGAALLHFLAGPWCVWLAASLKATWMSRAVETLLGLGIGAGAVLVAAALLGLPEPKLWLWRGRTPPRTGA
ncbi:MAG: murein biosynthesis integral membrane protein MurJ [Planctomycetota bacterium]|nr:MAG: murein biosynthesis integral membrane protein MurJ [Planctomycetota bacterium]